MLGLDCQVSISSQKLPAPLGPDEDDQIGEDGAKLWNPDWLAAKAAQHNRAFLQAAIDLMIADEAASPNQQVRSNLFSA
jgi:hypothetical protein